MLDVSSQPDETTFADFAHQWLTALADQRDQDASAMFDEANSYGIRWTVAKVREAIIDYGGQQITHPDTATGRKHHNLINLNDGSGFAFDHNIPIDGSWSDLTAQFEFFWRDGRLAAVLHDLHVL